jgi:hypothetical protein
MTLSSIIALIYSLFNRLSAALLLQAMKYTSAGSDVRDESDVDEMMMEYMTAMMQQAERQDGRARLISELSLKFYGGKGLPRLIVPLVIDEIFETANKTTSGGRGATAADSMLLHPIGDNQISTATIQTHDQILRRDLDLQDKKGFASGFARGEATVSGVVDAILGCCLVDEERGGAQIFTLQQDRWGRCDAAAEHVVAQLRSIGSSRPVQNQLTHDCQASGANTKAKVQRVLATPSSGAGKEGSSPQDVHGQFGGASSRDEYSSPLLAPLLHQHSQHSKHSSSTSDGTYHETGVSNSFSTDSAGASSTNASVVVSTSSGRRFTTVAGGVVSASAGNADRVGAGAGASSARRQRKDRQPHRRGFSSGTSMSRTSMASSGVRSAYHTAESTALSSDTASVRSFKTATAGSTTSLNDVDEDEESVTNSASVWSYVTAEEVGEENGHDVGTRMNEEEGV